MRRLAIAALVVLCAGAGAGCSTVDLGDPPADVNTCRPSQQFFVDQIWPNFLAMSYGGKRCSDGNCHDAGSAQAFHAVPPTTSPTVPLAAGSDWEANYISASKQMFCTNVRGSPLYTNPTNMTPHAGGMLIAPDGPEAQLIEMWVTAP